MSHKIVGVMIALLSGCCMSSRRMREARSLVEEQGHQVDGKELLDSWAHEEAPDPEASEEPRSKPTAYQSLLDGLAKTRGSWTIQDEATLRESKLLRCCKFECCFDPKKADARNDGYFHNVMSCSDKDGCPDDESFHEVEAQVCNIVDGIEPGSVLCDAKANRPADVVLPQAPIRNRAKRPSPLQTLRGDCCKNGRVCCAHANALSDRHFCSDPKDCRTEGMIFKLDGDGNPDDLVCAYINSMSANLVKCDP